MGVILSAAKDLQRLEQILRPLRGLRMTSFALLLTQVAFAQTGSVTGVIVSGVGDPLAFGTVVIESLGRRQFTDDSGRFALRGLPAGRHVLLVRRLGYFPAVDTVDVRADTTASRRYTLRRVVVSLRTVDVRAYPPCLRPGPPPRSRDSVLANVLEQVQLNAEQYRLLVKEYPFEYIMRAIRTRRLTNGRTVPVSRTDVPLSSSSAPYVPGHVIRQQDRAWYFSIPTLSELATPEFVQNHCWYFVGAQQVDTTTLLRVDVVAFDSLTTPDVNGSIYLAPESFQIRRTVLRLSRRFDKKKDMADMEVTTDFREVMPSIPVVSRMRSVQTMDADPKIRIAETIEEQTRRSFRFVGRKPGDKRP